MPFWSMMLTCRISLSKSCTVFSQSARSNSPGRAAVAAAQKLQRAVDLRQRARQMLVECAGEIHRILDRRPLGGVALVLQEEVDAQPDESDQQRADQRGAVADIRQPFGLEFPHAFAERHRRNAPQNPGKLLGNPLVFGYVRAVAARGMGGARGVPRSFRRPVTGHVSARCRPSAAMHRVIAAQSRVFGGLRPAGGAYSPRWTLLHCRTPCER